MHPFAPPPDPPGRPTLLNAFARIWWGMCVVLGERARPRTNRMPMPPVLVGLIATRLDRLRRRLFSLIERALAGTLAPMRPRASRAGASRAGASRAGASRAGASRAGASRAGGLRGRRPDGKPGPGGVERVPDRLPRAAGWLETLCPRTGSVMEHDLAPVRWEVEQVLRDEVLLRLLASDPRFGRVLRPLWRMLSPLPPPDCLRLPPRPRKPRAPRPKPESGLKLPRGVTRQDVARSRAMAPPGAPVAPPSPQPPQTAYGTATDWTPTHLTLGRRVSVFDPIPPRRRAEPDWSEVWYRRGNGT